MRRSSLAVLRLQTKLISLKKKFREKTVYFHSLKKSRRLEICTYGLNSMTLFVSGKTDLFVVGKISGRALNSHASKPLRTIIFYTITISLCVCTLDLHLFYPWSATVFILPSVSSLQSVFYIDRQTDRQIVLKSHLRCMRNFANSMSVFQQS